MDNEALLNTLEGTEIAVVGMAGRFPGAADVGEYWQNIQNGVESITSYTDDELRAAGVSDNLLRHPNYVKSGAPLADMEMFDAAFFGFGPRDAAIMDPQHRHFLEACWTAVEHAGYDPERFAGNIGVFGGSGHNAYMPYNLLTNPDLVASIGFFLLRHTGNDKDFLTTRVSYLMNLKGPSVNVQTACSTSLVAIHMASQSLLSGECDMALAGGVTIEMPHRQGYLYHEGEILSSDGHCRAFDHRADGTIFGSGVGVVTLKRMTDAIEDGDTIHAVIKGSAINNDGSGKVNYLAPSVDGQAAAIAEALALANVDAGTISLVEAHGTGTRIGDPIEVTALTQAFRLTTEKKQYCALGSVKSNIGHLDTAAGTAAFIKVVQALKNRQLPPNLNFEAPNPMLNIEESPFYVNTKTRPWSTNGAPRRAGVSSLGVGGTNAHVIVEEAPHTSPSSPPRPWQLLVLSAKSQSALEQATANMAEFFRREPETNLADAAYTMQLGRQPMPYRRVVAVRDTADAITALESGDKKRLASRKTGNHLPDVVFMFPGGGAQYPDMGRDLYANEPVYREAFDRCLELLQPQLDLDLVGLLFPPAEQFAAARETLHRPSYNLPTIFMTEYALAHLWLSWGIQPAAMTGHSMGEYTAACLAGVLSLADALSIVSMRGKLFETLPSGGMISVPLTEVALTPLLVEGCSIAVINNPELCVVSGEITAIEEMEAKLSAEGVEATRVRINVAAHSPMLDPILAEFGQKLARIQFHPPQIPFISNVTGTWITSAEATDPQYWVRHLRQTVRFADGLSTLLAEPQRLFLEVGPGQTLSSLVRMHPRKKQGHDVIPSLRHRKEAANDRQFALTALGRLWMAGLDLDWRTLYGDERRYRIPLPTYPFERQRHWIDPGSALLATGESVKTMLARMPLEDWFYRFNWASVPLPAPIPAEPQTWLLFVDSLGLGAALAEKLRADEHIVITVTSGEQFKKIGSHAYQVNPRARIDYDTLVAELADHQLLPQRICHLWTINHRPAAETPMRFYYRNQDLGFFSLFFLAQALGDESVSKIHFTLITNGMQRVADEALPYPEKSTLLGPCKVIPREFPQMTVSCVDVDLPRELPAVARGPFVKRLFLEVLAQPGSGIFALRNGKRWQQGHEKTALPEANGGSLLLPPDPVVLITGGLGGIGLTMAAHLAQTHGARLILVARSGLPQKHLWADWLKHHGALDRTSRRIKTVQALEESGVDLHVIQADVTNRQQLTTAIVEAKVQYGRIDGLIHTAGVLDDNLIQLKTPQDVDRVLAPKVRGTLLLDELLAADKLSFMFLFSSTSTIIGSAGQVDYVAANAFLNSFAESKAALPDAPYTVAVNWGVWQEVGMAVDAATRLGMIEGQKPVGDDVPHPLLDQIIIETDQEFVFASSYRADTHWILDQHRLKDGQALIPGTGYLELAKAAMTRGRPDGIVEINDLFFLSPLEVGDEETREVRVSLEKNGRGYGLSVASKNLDFTWQEHARATIREGLFAPPPAIDVAAVRARCQGAEVCFAPREQETQQEEFLNFGPRWKNLRQINYGAGEALARLELLPEFQNDLQEFTIHPALMDLATSAGLPLVEGYATGNDFYVPLSYKQVRIYGDLPQRIFSHVRHKQDGHDHRDVPSFDITIMDENGCVLVEIEEFMVKRVAYETMAAPRTGREAIGQSANNVQEPTLLQLALTDGIRPAEGMVVIDRLLAASGPPQIVVTSLDLDGLIAQANRAQDEETGIKMSRPNLQSDYTAPRNEIEQSLAEIWKDLLGIDEIGVEDDFFELGGHSLIAVRLFAQIKKMYAVDLSLATLFEAPTIAECADLLQKRFGVQATTAKAAGKAARPPRQVRGTDWRPLVPIQTRGSQPPFFCVHGGFGNVLNFYDLTRYLGNDQPFYGLQAQGVDGKRPVAGSIPEMAALYIGEMKTIQPAGPYYLGGFSMGGEVAYEIAQQLTVQGHDVALLALLDTHNPEFSRRIKTMLITAEVPIWMQPQTPEDEYLPTQENGVINSLRRIKKLVDYRWRQIRYVSNREWLAFRCRLLIKIGRTLPQELISPYLWRGHFKLLLKYELQLYPGRVTLFRASETALSNPSGPGIGWERFARGGLDIQMIHGTHNIVREPYVSELARLLRVSLEKAKKEQQTD